MEKYLVAKAKKQSRDVLAGKRDPVSQLYRAVRRYVEHHNGNIIIIGGIGLGVEDSKGHYVIQVRCFGKPPTFSDSATGEPK
jgi:hypothetical protein